MNNRKYTHTEKLYGYAEVVERERRQRAARADTHRNTHTREKRMIFLALAGLSFGKMAESTTRGPQQTKRQSPGLYIKKERESLDVVIYLGYGLLPFFSLVIFTSG